MRHRFAPEKGLLRHARGQRLPTGGRGANTLFPLCVGKYIPLGLVESHGETPMKVQKIVSLDENTMKISQRMENFSQWVRMGLRSYENGEDLATETMRRIKWAKVAQIFAATIVEHAIELDENYQGSVDELIAQALKEVQNQTSLRDFE